MSERTAGRYEDYYERVYGAEDAAAEGTSHGWIQWKGTSVCIDLHCPCGHHGHVDAEFFYRYVCGGCGQKYALGQIVKLIPLPADLAAHYEDDDYQADTSVRSPSEL